MLRFHHIAIVCTDLDRSQRFYEEVMGMEVQIDYGASEPDVRKDRLLGLTDVSSRTRLLGNDELRIELIEYASPRDVSGSRPAINRLGLSHIALQSDDVARDYERLKRLGVPCNSEPVDFGSVIAVYARDPDGNTIEWLQLD